MKINLWGSNWSKAEKEEVAVLSYGTVIIEIPYTIIHHLGNILPRATKDSHLKEYDDKLIEALGEIEKQMGERFWPKGE